MLACTNSDTHVAPSHLTALLSTFTLGHPQTSTPLQLCIPTPLDTQTLFFSCFLALNSSVQPCQVLIEALARKAAYKGGPMAGLEAPAGLAYTLLGLGHLGQLFTPPAVALSP